MSASVWKSERLIYRSPDPSDEPFLASHREDSLAWTQASPELPTPPRELGGKESREWLEKCLIGVLICLPVSEAEATATSSDGKTQEQQQRPKPKPIGSLSLSGGDKTTWHHRASRIGIMLALEYTGQGYGTEAIEWALRWGFVYAGLHRIGIGAVGHNVGALRLYRRLGFVEEGRARECWWFEGRFWDMIGLGMLEGEWRAREAAKQKAIEQR